MKERTREFIERVNQTPLFRGEGTIDPARHVVVTNVQPAVKSAHSPGWEHFCDTLYDKLITERIQQELKRQGSSLLKLTDEIRPALQPSSSRVERLGWAELSYTPPLFMIMAICLEVECADVFDPVFFLPHLWPALEAGHFVCGWEGEDITRDWDPNRDALPPGKLIVLHIDAEAQEAIASGVWREWVD